MCCETCPPSFDPHSASSSARIAAADSYLRAANTRRMSAGLFQAQQRAACRALLRRHAGRFRGARGVCSGSTGVKEGGVGVVRHLWSGFLARALCKMRENSGETGTSISGMGPVTIACTMFRKMLPSKGNRPHKHLTPAMRHATYLGVSQGLQGVRSLQAA